LTAQGTALLHDNALNESTAFTSGERNQFGLTGLLPTAIETLDTQVKRCLMQLTKKPNLLEQYIYLNQLADDNQTLFFKLLSTDPERFLPIVYDPVVADACLQFGHIYRRPNGIYLSIEQRGKVKEVLSNWPVKDVRFICVSSGERILGLGDIGANGMGIPVGKMQLYTTCAGVPPERLLPLLLDSGTNNESMLADPLYLGLRQKRASTKDLDSFVDEFVDVVQELYPQCCIHFEDWKGADAQRLLAKYKDKVCCYNDDIQGTGSVILAALYNALKISKGTFKDQRILMFGAGSAGVGISNMIVSALQLEGVSVDAARGQISLFDVKGLIEPTRTDLDAEQKNYAHKNAPTKSLLDAVNSIKPTILIGTSTVGKTFTKEVVEAMTKLNPRPIIFAISNPTKQAECSAEEAYTWSDGKAIYAGGVQFPPVKLGGKTYLPTQANNVYIFPAICLAVYVTAAKRVPDELFIEAAKALSDQVTSHQLDQGLLLPPQKDILKIEIETAITVAKKVFELGLARIDKPADVAKLVHASLYKTEYAHTMKQ
jgi:malate dehydrogenase (oxaloacetate-decarboxylating)(NADP+)